MDDLVRQITDRFNIEPEKATGIISHVVGFMKDKLPGPVAGQLDRFLPGTGDAGDADDSDGGGGLLGQAKGLLGG